MRFVFDMLADAYEVDPNIIDLVLWFPHLTWGQFACAAAGVLAWSWVSERMFRALRRFFRRRILVVISPMFFRIARRTGLYGFWCELRNRLQVGIQLSCQPNMHFPAYSGEAIDGWQVRLRAALGPGEGTPITPIGAAYSSAWPSENSAI